MRVNIFVDGAQVGSRIGCDVRSGSGSCGKTAAAGGNLFHGGQPRDICEACMVQLAPGLLPFEFASSRYDTADERYATASIEASVGPAVEGAEAIEAVSAPAFPSCPHCGARAFAVSQVLIEATRYDWDGAALSFRRSGPPMVEQQVWHHCAACNEAVPAELLQAWIS